MKATGTYELVRDVDPNEVLSEHTREHIDHWVAKFPPDRKRSAVIQGLFAAQEQNQGHLTDVLIAAVAKYLGLPEVWAYEVATFYSMLETRPVGRNNVAFCTNISCWLNGAEDLVAHAEKKLGCRLGQSTADGRGWNQPGPLNGWAISSEPITLPSRTIRLPLACAGNSACAAPVTASG